MKKRALPSSVLVRRSLRLFFFFVAAGLLIAGCNSGGMSSTPTPPTPENTNVAVLLTSDANDQLQEFFVQILSFTLTDDKGNVVALFSNTNPSIPTLGQPAEFMHLNGTAEPLVTVSVPQGTYTSATVKAGYCSFNVVYVDPTNSVTNSYWSQSACAQATGTTTVNVASPIVVSGTGMVVSLDLQVSQSYTLSGTNTGATYTINPVFALNATSTSQANTAMKLAGIDAQITSVNGSEGSFVAQTANGASLTVNANSSTSYQNIPGLSSLGAGMMVNMDLNIQADASLAASRVQVNDANTTDVGAIGPLMMAASLPDSFLTDLVDGVGCMPSGNPECGPLFEYDGNTAFGVSGQFSNLANLPFAATFNNSTFFPGEKFLVYSQPLASGEAAESVSAVILSSQTINGTIGAIASENGFSVYTVYLAPYDLIPTLSGQAGSPYVPITDANSVTVYADANTRVLTQTPAVGSLLRLRGVIFNDNGTLRMDCEQINDGVTE
jgi:hypothetical protein